MGELDEELLELGLGLWLVMLDPNVEMLGREFGVLFTIGTLFEFGKVLNFCCGVIKPFDN